MSCCEAELAAGNNKEGTQYVGVQAYLRKRAVFLSRSRRYLSGRLDVLESLVLADDLLCRRFAMSCRRVGYLAETT